MTPRTSRRARRSPRAAAHATRRRRRSPSPRPPNGATVAGTTAVTASASDDNGVAGVQFKLDGAQPRRRRHEQPVLDRLERRRGQARRAHADRGRARRRRQHRDVLAGHRHGRGSRPRATAPSPPTRSTTAPGPSQATRPATGIQGTVVGRHVGDRQVRLGAELRRRRLARRPRAAREDLQARLHARGVGQEGRAEARRR